MRLRGGDVNRAANTAWFVRRQVREYPNGYILTTPEDEIRITWFEHEDHVDTIFLSRGNARLLAKRINQCLDETVKK